MEGVTIVLSLLALIVTAVLGFLIGKRNEQSHIAVRDSDVYEGIVKRKQEHNTLQKSVPQLHYEASKESDAVVKRLQEAPNEEIVDIFMDAFGTDPPNFGYGSGYKNGIGSTRPNDL